jgi:hypothetical protein
LIKDLLTFANFYFESANRLMATDTEKTSINATCTIREDIGASQTAASCE